MSRQHIGLGLRTVGVCLFALSAAATGGWAQAPAQRVDVELQGVEGEAERNVRAVLGIARAEGEDLTAARIQQLHRAAEADIRTALEPFGYYRPSIQRSITRAGDRWSARYVVEPGPPIIVRNVDIVLSGDGADSAAFRKAIAEFPLQQGDTLRHLPWEAAKLALLTLASDSGYLVADFDTAAILVDRNEFTADLLVRFDTGPRYRFGPVTFNQTILDTALLNTRIPFKRGDVFQLHKLLELQTSLSEDPYFNRVEVNPRPDRANAALETPIVVDLAPRPTQAYEVGLGYGTDNGPRGRASLDLRRINRSGHYGRAEVVGAFVEQSISTEYNIPAFGHPKGVLTFVAGYAILNPSTSNSRSIRAGARLSRPRLGWRESFSLTYQRTTFEVGVDTGTSTLFIPGASWERTRSDSRIFPSSGLRLRLDLQGSRKGLLAKTSFFQARINGKVIRSLGPRLRVLARAEVGRTFTSAFRELPPTLRFFTGGDVSVRGFGYLSLGPRIRKLTIGGPNLAVGSVETDFRVMPRWAVAVFTDAGNAFDETLDLQQSIGAGIRWLSPVGLIRVDVAQPITTDDARPRLHLSIGPDL